MEGEVAGYEESRWCAVDLVDGMATGRLLLWGMSGRRRLCPSTPTARVYALAMGEWMKSGWSRRKEWMTSTPCHPLQWGKIIKYLLRFGISGLKFRLAVPLEWLSASCFGATGLSSAGTADTPGASFCSYIYGSWIRMAAPAAPGIHS